MSDLRTDRYLASLTGKSAATLRCYRPALDRFFKFCGKREPSAKGLQAWLTFLERHLKLSPNSIGWNATVVKGYLLSSGTPPAELSKLSVPAAVKPYREHIAPDDWDRFLNAMVEKEDRLVFELLLYTGMRIGALLRLRPQDIHWKERMLYLYGTQPVPATESVLRGLYERIRDNRLGSSAIIFANWSEKQVGQKLRIYAKKAGLRNAARLVPHSTRHSFAIRFIQESTRPSGLEDLRRFLGHARITTTQSYLTYSMKESRTAYDEVFSTKKQGEKAR